MENFFYTILLLLLFLFNQGHYQLKGHHFHSIQDQKLFKNEAVLVVPIQSYVYNMKKLFSHYSV